MSDKEYRAEQIAREAAKRLDEVRAGSSKSELLPCPFCGGEAEINGANKYGWSVWCKKCHSNNNWGHAMEQEAIEAWNTRVETVTVTGTTIVTDTPRITYVPERTCKRITLGLERKREIATVSWVCSACGKHMSRDDNYCPNCGARVKP